MKSYLLNILILIAICTAACKRGFLPFDIQHASASDFHPTPKDSIIQRLFRNGLDTSMPILFPNNYEYAASSHPKGQNVRLFNAKGQQVAGNLCHADFPLLMTELLKGEKHFPKIISDRNFFTDDLPNVSSSTTLLDTAGIDYIMAYYWWNYDYHVHGRFNWIRKELIQMQQLQRTKGPSSEKNVLLVAINCDNRPLFKKSGKEFFSHTYLYEAH